MRNRTVIGLICVVAAMAIVFGLAPLTNRITERKAEIVRMKNPVAKGTVITEENLETVTVGAFNLPDGVVTDKNDVISKYAAADLYEGDYLFPVKVRERGNSAEEVLETLDGSRQAVSVSVTSYAAGVSGKLMNGDIVTVYVYQDGKVLTPGELTYMRVITTTSAGGVDCDRQTETREQPATITLMATKEQAKLLVLYEKAGLISCGLVYRGNDETAELFLKEQDEYLKGVVNRE